MDKIYPNTFNFGAVKWNAKFDYEYMENYKILNNAFVKNGVQKNLDVDKLVKCRLLDNTEMCQWIKKYYELHYTGNEYDPVGRRKGQDLHYILGGNKVAAPPKVSEKKPTEKIGGGTTAPAMRPATGTGPKTFAKAPTSGPKFGGASAAAAITGGSASVSKLEQQVTELQNNNQILDKEREFYFSKLRLIEEML